MNGLNTLYGIPRESHTTGFSVAWVVLAVVLAVLGAWFYARVRKASLRSEQHTPKDDGGSRTSGHQDTSQSRDAYTILGVRRGDSFDEIRRAYRDRMKEYHPDKVAGLGAELRELAERKAKEINMAFEELKRTNGAA
jgi:DnaJ-domain-containing protein 1